MTMTTITQTGTCIFARPYDLAARGFYFHDLEDYETQAAALRNQYGLPVEEFEFMYIEGDDGRLFEACGIDQCTLADWFDDVEPLDDHEKAALFYLCNECGYDLSAALGKVEEVCLYQGRLLDAATELFDECYLPDVPEAVRNYIDYEAFANDCRCGGDMAEFTYQGETWTVTNASEV
jgi:hypothetical protein